MTKGEGQMFVGALMDFPLLETVPMYSFRFKLSVFAELVFLKIIFREVLDMHLYCVNVCLNANLKLFVDLLIQLLSQRHVFPEPG